jgi:hypothetical protein
MQEITIQFPIASGGWHKRCNSADEKWGGANSLTPVSISFKRSLKSAQNLLIYSLIASPFGY